MSRVLQQEHSKDATAQARIIAAPFPGDDDLVRWTAKMIGAANDFQAKKRPDPLAGYLPR